MEAESGCRRKLPEIQRLFEAWALARLLSAGKILWGRQGGSMYAGNLLSRFVREESGQAISEYGAVLAFVAVLVVVVFKAANGGMKHAISGCFSALIHQLNSLSSVQAS
jgi:Flp pilus assembly pilin Flp